MPSPLPALSALREIRPNLGCCCQAALTLARQSVTTGTGSWPKSQPTPEPIPLSLLPYRQNFDIGVSAFTCVIALADSFHTPATKTTHLPTQQKYLRYPLRRHRYSPCSEEDVCEPSALAVYTCLRRDAYHVSHRAVPQVSAEELRAAEAEASYTVQQGVAAAVALYLCMCYPS